MHGNDINSRPIPSGRPSVKSQAPLRGVVPSQNSHSSLEVGSVEGSYLQDPHAPNGIPTWASRLPMSSKFMRGCRMNQPGPWNVDQVLMPRICTTTMDRVGHNLAALSNSEGCEQYVLGALAASDHSWSLRDYVPEGTLAPILVQRVANSGDLGLPAAFRPPGVGADRFIRRSRLWNPPRRWSGRVMIISHGFGPYGRLSWRRWLRCFPICL